MLGRGPVDVARIDAGEVGAFGAEVGMKGVRNVAGHLVVRVGSGLRLVDGGRLLRCRGRTLRALLDRRRGTTRDAHTLSAPLLVVVVPQVRRRDVQQGLEAHMRPVVRPHAGRWQKF